MASSIDDNQGDKSTPSQIDDESVSTPSVSSIFEDGHRDSHRKIEVETTIPQVVKGDSLLPNENQLNLNTEASHLDILQQPLSVLLPPIVVHKHTDDSLNENVSKELAIDAFKKSVSDGKEDFEVNGEFDDEDDIQDVRKMSCCYGCGVFFILCLGLGALTSLVIYAGFWYLLQQEGKYYKIQVFDYFLIPSFLKCTSTPN